MLKVLEGGKSEKSKTKDNERARAAVAAVAAGGMVLPMDLDELAREGARVMLKHALRIEADDYVERYADDGDGLYDIRVSLGDRLGRIRAGAAGIVLELEPLEERVGRTVRDRYA
jgi:hypothetical protein